MGGKGAPSGNVAASRSYAGDLPDPVYSIEQRTARVQARPSI
jgi:hypothetical protein